MVNLNTASLPIGVFDSGFGGLTVVKALQKLLPYEDIIYLGDAARLPYGDKSKDTIIKYTLEGERFLSDKGIKLFVIACHTASSLSVPILQSHSHTPIIGMVEPCIPKLISRAKAGKIAILGTKATISSKIYQAALEMFIPKENIISIACPLFAPVIEEGLIDSKIIHEVIEHYLLGLKKEPIKTALLACTHYPLIQSSIQSFLGEDCECIDPAYLCALHVQDILNSQNLLNKSNSASRISFYTTDDPEKFRSLGERFLSSAVRDVKKVII